MVSEHEMLVKKPPGLETFLQDDGAETEECQERSPEKVTSSPEHEDSTLDNTCRGCGTLWSGDGDPCRCGGYYASDDEGADTVEDLASPKRLEKTIQAVFGEHGKEVPAVQSPGERFQQLLVDASKGEGPLCPLTIDPVSLRPTALPLNATW